MSKITYVIEDISGDISIRCGRKDFLEKLIPVIRKVSLNRIQITRNGCIVMHRGMKTLNIKNLFADLWLVSK